MYSMSNATTESKMLVETVTETRIVVDWAAVAEQLEARVMARMHDSINHWHNDIGMRALAVSDAGDGLGICEMLSTGSVDGVNDALWDMDTAPREEVICWIEDIVGAEAVQLIW